MLQRWMLQNTTQGHMAETNLPATNEPNITPQTTNQQQAMIAV